MWKTRPQDEVQSTYDSDTPSGRGKEGREGGEEEEEEEEEEAMIRLRVYMYETSSAVSAVRVQLD